MDSCGTGPAPVKTAPTELRGSFGKPDQRSEQRFLVEKPIRIIHRKSEVAAWLVECSNRGIRIVSPVPMECDEHILAEINLNEVGTVSYQVRYWFRLWPGAYQIGAELADGIDQAQATAVFRALVPADASPMFAH